MPGDDDLRYWLALARTRGVSPSSARVMLEATGGTARAVFEAGRSNYQPDVARASAWKAVREFDDWAWVDAEMERAASLKVGILSLGDPAYPPLLAETPDPPVVLYTRGRAGNWAPAVAIVGTRYPSKYGRRVSETISAALAASGMVVVSGLARGCDSAAHRGALAGGGGAPSTVAVLGCGIDRVYPPENERLFSEIIEAGVLVSEYPLGASPVPGNFPRRNRIIAGLSLGVLVVEAPERSGALMTAELALDYNRDVFAVPGEVTSNKSSGTNKLLKEGAMLATEAADVLIGLGLASRHSRGDGNGGSRKAPRVEAGRAATRRATPVRDEGPLQPALAGGEAAVWGALDGGPMHIDTISTAAGVSSSEASAHLLSLELKGLVEQLPGKQFSRKLST